MSPTPDASTAVLVTEPAERLLSLDVLRGFDMFWIIGAENLVEGLHELQGSETGVLHFIATQLQHVPWEGFHFYDMIFPLFVFMIGMSIVFSLDKILAREGQAAAHKRIFRRFLLMFALGLFYYGGFAHVWPEVRVLGVLQRLALCYFFTSLLYCHLKPRGLAVALFVCLVGYWAALSFIPAPGQPAVSFAPGENLANYVDFRFLPGRLYDKTWDPEGLLSTIPAIGSCLLGVFAALFIKRKDVPELKKALLIAGAGAAMVALGFLWGFQFPVIKKIWTSSFVLVAGGYSCLLLAAFYWLVDIRKSRWWTTPFLWIGSNAITLYLAWNLIDFDEIAKRFAGGNIEIALGAYGPLLLAAVTLALPIALGRFLYKRNIFLRV